MFRVQFEEIDVGDFYETFTISMIINNIMILDIVRQSQNSWSKTNRKKVSKTDMSQRTKHKKNHVRLRFVPIEPIDISPIEP